MEQEVLFCADFLCFQTLGFMIQAGTKVQNLAHVIKSYSIFSPPEPKAQGNLQDGT